jgi:hypothetical protein
VSIATSGRFWQMLGNSAFIAGFSVASSGALKGYTHSQDG